MSGKTGVLEALKYAVIGAREQGARKKQEAEPKSKSAGYNKESSLRGVMQLIKDQDAAYDSSAEELLESINESKYVRNQPDGRFTNGNSGVNAGEVGKKWDKHFQK